MQNGLLPPMRLQDHNQPRHVQIKEILTGDMILKPEQSAMGPPVVLNPERHGPGCWFVPRMSGTQQVRTQWHACAEVGFVGDRPVQKACASNADCSSGTDCVEIAVGSSICIERGGGGHQNAFHFMIDREEPRPHIQEVYDEQLQTGLMDNLANTAIFAVAMRSTAAAASVALRPSGAPSLSAKTASMVSSDTPPAPVLSRSGFIRPSNMLASEIVGRSPPLP